MKIDRHQPLHNNRKAVDGEEILLLKLRLFTAADWER
jgi:hypothetical protein